MAAAHMLYGHRISHTLTLSHIQVYINNRQSITYTNDPDVHLSGYRIVLYYTIMIIYIYVYMYCILWFCFGVLCSVTSSDICIILTHAGMYGCMIYCTHTRIYVYIIYIFMQCFLLSCIVLYFMERYGMYSSIFKRRRVAPGSKICQTWFFHLNICQK